MVLRPFLILYTTLATENLQQTADETKEIASEGAVVLQQTASNVDDVKRMSFSNFIIAEAGSIIYKEDQLRANIRKWLSPPDSSTNHNIARGSQHEGTTTWLFEGGTYEKWKSTPSLLWIHGKRVFFPFLSLL